MDQDFDSLRQFPSFNRDAEWLQLNFDALGSFTLKVFLTQGIGGGGGTPTPSLPPLRFCASSPKTFPGPWNWKLAFPFGEIIY